MSAQPQRATVSRAPARSATVAVRHDGEREFVARVTDDDGDFIRIAPSPRLRADSIVELAWGAGGAYHRGRARVIEADGAGAWLAVGVTRPLERRLFQRVAPPRPIEAEVRVLDRRGAVVQLLRCPVRDLSIGGIGMFLDRALAESVAVEITLRDAPSGRVILTRAKGEIVRVTVDPRGQIAGARFSTVFECVHALADLLEERR